MIFFELKKEEEAFLRNSFSTSLAIANILDEVQQWSATTGPRPGAGP